MQFPVLTRLGSQLQTVIPIGIPALKSSDWDPSYRQFSQLGSQCPIVIPFHLDWNPGFRQLSRIGSQFQIFILNGISTPDAYPGLSRQYHRDCIGIPMDPIFVFSWGASSYIFYNHFFPQRRGGELNLPMDWIRLWIVCLIGAHNTSLYFTFASLYKARE